MTETENPLFISNQTTLVLEHLSEECDPAVAIAILAISIGRISAMQPAIRSAEDGWTSIVAKIELLYSMGFRMQRSTPGGAADGN